MRIQGSLPINIARAYGVNPAARPPAVASPASVMGGPGGPSPTAATPATGSPTNVGSAGGLSSLIAARVPHSVEFDGHPAPLPNAGLQLYTRAADRIEAAVGVELGRVVDAQG